MIQAEDFITQATAAGFGLYTGVPCSYLQPFINYVIDAPNLRYVGAANEGDALAIASGAQIGGMRAVVMFQNSGLGNAVNPLTSLNAILRIPVLVIVTLRGEPGGPADEPQHELMGAITTSMLDLMQLPWEYFPTDAAQIASTLARATRHMDQARTPYVLVMKKGSVAAHALQAAVPTPHPRGTLTDRRGASQAMLPWRSDVLEALRQRLRSTDVIVASTGFTGRELYALGDHANQIYMVGSMGCASSLGLGLAVAQPRRRIFVVDGDGALLMRLGALATIGNERPSNLVHVLLDNGQHESTGGQATVSHNTDFPAIALACGYPRAVAVDSVVSMAEWMDTSLDTGSAALTFVEVAIRAGCKSELPRPKIRPDAAIARFEQWMRTTGEST
ncbi:MAG TPA: phosphonopyruvate decarboxylase [Pseudomonadales bacterium]